MEQIVEKEKQVEKLKENLNATVEKLGRINAEMDYHITQTGHGTKIDADMIERVSF